MTSVKTAIVIDPHVRYLEISYYPLANEVAKGYSNASFRPSVRPSFRNILVNREQDNCPLGQ